MSCSRLTKQGVPVALGVACRCRTCVRLVDCRGQLIHRQSCPHKLNSSEALVPCFHEVSSHVGSSIALCLCNQSELWLDTTALCNELLMLAYAPEAPSFGAISTSARHVCFIQRYRPSRRFGQPSLQHCKSRTWHWQLDAATKELPIFPLNCVAFPACSTPLHIFEARCVPHTFPGSFGTLTFTICHCDCTLCRFRVLFNTLLSGESG